MSKEYLLLNNLDKPVKIFVFTVTEFAVIFSTLFAGILSGHFYLAVASIVGGGVLYKKFFQRFTSGTFKELGYFHFGIGEHKLHFKIPSFMKRMVG